MRCAFACACVLGAACGDDARGASDAGPSFQPSFDAGEAWVVDIAASPSGDRAWAVGGTDDQGMVWDSENDFSGQAVDDAKLLHWVHAFSDDEAFLVGKAGTVLHMQGGVFEKQPTPTEQDLWGVWGATVDDVWAVGGDGQKQGHATVLHYDGESWSEAQLPTLERPHVWAFYKVWGSSADDVYVVGQSGGVLHFDGESFEELGLGTAEDLISVWGTGPDRVAVVGGRGSGVLATFDGQDWTTTSLSPLPGLNGVWMRDANTLYVAGIQGTLAEIDFDTHQVTRTPLPEPSKLTFHAIHGFGERLIAVGGNLGSSVPPYQSLTAERELPRRPRAASASREAP